MTDQLRPTGETLHGQPTYVAGYGTRQQATVFADGRGKWLASNGYITERADTKEDAARRFRESWDEIHG